MANILDVPEIRAQVHVWTVAEYEKLEDNPAFRRSELIRGVILDRPPKPPLQSCLVGRLNEELRRAVGAGLSVWQYRPLRLADSVPEPDAAVVRGTLGDFQHRHPDTAELVAEVAVGSVTLDRLLAPIYAEAGVKEYWIVLAEKEQVEVYRRPFGGDYMERRNYLRSEAIENVEVIGGAFAVERLFERQGMRDEG